MGRWRDYLFESATSLGWTCVGIAYLLVPDTAGRSAIGHEVHPLDTLWSLFYVIGGPMVYWALGDALRVRWHVAGLLLLAAGLMMQAVAVAVYALDTRVGLYAVYATACALRAVVCIRIYERTR